MIKCKNSCPLGKFDGCCVECEFEKVCKEVCDADPIDCEESIMDDVSEETGLEVFQQGQEIILKQIANIITTKKSLDEQEKQLKEKLKEAMEFYGVKKFESNHLTITYVAETTTTTIDTSKLKKKYPEIVKECSRETKKSAYVRVSIK